MTPHLCNMGNNTDNGSCNENKKIGDNYNNNRNKGDNDRDYHDDYDANIILPDHT